MTVPTDREVRSSFLDVDRQRITTLGEPGGKLVGSVQHPGAGVRLLQRYAYRLTTRGIQVALLFLFFHERPCGPFANRRFHHKPDPHYRPDSRLEASYHRADEDIQNIVDLLNAA